MGTYLVVLAVALAAEPAKDVVASPPHVSRPATSSKRISPRKLRDAIHSALRREAITTGALYDDAVRHLVDVYNTLEEDRQLPEAERTRRLGQIRYRLANVADRLERDANEAPTDKSPQRRAAQVVGDDADRGAANNILAQQAAGQAVGVRGQAAPAVATPQASPAGTAPGEAAGAQQLIELIQNTIAPNTWDVRGGPGTIMYFPPKKVLVIRQTSDVHQQFRNVIRQLRQN